MQLGTIGQHNRITRQLDPAHLTYERQNVASEQVSLVFRCRKENLITPSVQGIDKSLTGKVVRGADLAAFEDHTCALITCPVPVFLVVKTAIDKRLAQQLDLVFADLVFECFFLRLAVALGKVRIEISFSASALIAHDPRLPLQLAVQQINFLEVAAGLALFEDQLHQARFQCAADALDVVRPIPLVAGLPAV